MDGNQCDRHPSARAKARVLLPSLRELYVCGHCASTLNFGDDFYIEYETVKVGASSGD
jgi:hypothetical protein